MSTPAPDTIVTDAGADSTGTHSETATESKPLAAKLKDAFNSLIRCGKDDQFYSISEKLLLWISYYLCLLEVVRRKDVEMKGRLRGTVMVECW